MSMSHRANHLRLVPAPQSEPPYDDEGRSGFCPDPPAMRGAVQGALALPLPAALSAPAHPRLRVLGPADAAGPLGSGPPPVARWAGSFVQAIVEVLCGRRPFQQMVRWTSADVFEQLRRHASRPWRVQHLPSPKSVHWSEPCAGVAEVSCVIQVDARRHAVALRLEDHRGRWRCTALELGPIR